MNCEQTREKLRRRFDAGEDWDTLAEPHLTACADCQGYLARLQALEESLFEVPLEPMSANLAARIQERVQAEAFEAGRVPRYLGYGLAAGFAAAGLLGWFFPMSLDLSAWWSALPNALPGMDWTGAFQPAVSGLQRTWESMTTQVDRLPGLSSFNMGVGIVSAVALLVVFNVLEAASVQKSPVGSTRGYRTAR